MAVTDDILATYRAPGRTIAAIQARPAREERALAYLIAALILIFVAQWPGLSRAAALQPDVPLAQRMLAAFLASLAMLPVFYGLAALGHLAARGAGGRGSYYAGRVALFWALLAVAPLMLLQGLVTGMIGPGPGLTALRGIVFAVFLLFWFHGLRASHFGRAQQ